jgi:chromosome partitioning protein
METVAFLSQKGGAGKSTIAANIAVTASRHGDRVVILDMDPSRTLVKWRDARGDADIDVEPIETGDLQHALALAEAKGATLALVDTPGTASGPLIEAAQIADLCVIPVRPNAFDLWASEETVKLLRGRGADFTFLLNQCPPIRQKNRVRQSLDALEAIGGIIKPMVSSRVDYQDAARLGLGAIEYHPRGAAAIEMLELWRSLEPRLKRRSRTIETLRAAPQNIEVSTESAFNPYLGLFDDALNVGKLYTSFVRVLLAESERFSSGAESGQSGKASEGSTPDF